MTKREYESLPRELAAGLRSLDWRVRGLAVLKGGGVLAAVAGAALASGLFVDWLIDVGVAARMGLLIGVIAVAAVTLTGAIVWPLLRRASAGELAALVDAAYPDLGERIESVVELSDATVLERHRGSSLMRSRLLDETLRRSRTIDFGQAAETSPALRWVVIGAWTVLLLLAPLGLSRDGYGLLLSRFLAPWQNRERATNLYFHIENGDRAVARGSDVTIIAEPRWRIMKGTLPDQAWLHWRSGEGERGGAGETDARRMEFDAESGTYRVTLPHVLAALDYEVSAGRARTRTYHIDVVEAPSIKRVVMSIDPPAYTGRAARVLDGPAGRVEVFERSRLTFRLEFSKPVVSAALQWLSPNTATDFADPASVAQSALPVTLDGDGRSGMLTLFAARGGPVRFELRDEQHVPNLPLLDEEPLELVLIADEPPAVEWADVGRSGPQPGAAIEVRPGDRLPLAVLASDDVGLAELELHAEVVQRSEALAPLQADDSLLGRANIEHAFAWDLSPFLLQEGDLLSVRARAVDTRPLPGPQDAWTVSRLVRITADSESIEKSLLTEQQQRLRDLLEAVRENVQQDRNTTESLRKTARESGAQPLPPAQQQEMTNLAEREEKLTQRLDQLAAVFADHPLLRNIAEPTRAVGTDPLTAARKQIQQAAAAAPQEQLEPLTNAADELARADQQLGQLLNRFDELAALEQDLQRLQKMAEDAERLSNDVADFEKQWDDVTQSQELADQQRQALKDALNEQHGQLTNDQQALASSLDQLLEERPEVLEAAVERQRERLQELSEQAS
ncbi:MAG: hypothetical protein AB7Q45_20280, partial [Planctomycetaceae bacterium]